MTDPDATAFWESRYGDAGRIWSGHPNRALVDEASAFEPGRALDLGCGEGADAIWLALRGWQVVGVDISPTAIGRARAAADEAGVPGEAIRWIVADLASWEAGDSYDLVTVSFLHSPVSLPRTEVLRRAADAVAAGGRLLIVSHAAPPPWAALHEGHHHESPLLSPQQELDELRLSPAEWKTEVAEVREREAVGPTGEAAVLRDGVILLRRR